MTHPGTATMLAARLERPLEWIIQANMPNLSNRMRAKLFEGYGPFGSFSAKIDVALAFGFITAEDARVLAAIKDIRNEFAHAEDELHFHHPTIVKLIDKLPNRGAKDPFAAYTDACSDCAGILGATLERLNQNKIRRAQRAARKASPQKSA